MVSNKVSDAPPAKTLVTIFFSEKSVDKLHQKIASEEWKTTKLYDAIETGISKLLSESGSISEKASDGDVPPSKQFDPAAAFPPDRFEELKEILKFSETEEIEISKTEMLRSAVESRHKSIRKYDKAKKVPGNEDKASLRHTREICTSYMIVKALCALDSKKAFNSEDDDRSAFQLAAHNGSNVLLEIMIAELEQSNTPREEALRLISRPYQKQTPVQLAVEGLHVEVLRVLIGKYPSLADATVLQSVLRNLKDRKSEKEMKSQEKALEIFKLIFEAKPSHNSTEIWKDAVTMPSTKAVRFLLNGPETNTYATYENAEAVIRSGNSTIWNLFRKEDRDRFISQSHCRLLHLAVSERKGNCVDAILSEYPDEINRKVVREVNGGKEEYAMHRLKDKNDVFDNSLRNRLLHAMIRCSELNIRQIKQILKESGVEASFMTLSFPKLESSDVTFADYVRWMKIQPESIYNFEEVLRLAAFPELDTDGMPKTPEDWKIRHTEISEVFEWLRAKNVRTVLRLSVSDRLHCPHSDDDVQMCVSGFGVMVLNWRKLDLYLGNLYPTQNERAHLRELHLFSSGKRAVLDHWYHELPKFPNLTKLYVNVVEDIMERKHADKMALEIQNQLNDINQRMSYRWTSTVTPENDNMAANNEPKVTVTVCPWKNSLGGDVPINITEDTFEIIGPNLKGFLSKFCTYYRINKQAEKTKVALIDSGVVVYGGKAKVASQSSNVIGTDLANRVVEGISLTAKDNEDDVCWHPNEPHGTQMAQLICSINPCCELYVAKVTESRNAGVSANNVADAIHWAISKKVDVISLSLVTRDVKEERLSTALRKARDKDIVIMSSTTDSGYRKVETIATKDTVQGDVISIVACSNNGHLLENSQPDGYEFSFLGNVHVNPVPTLQSNRLIQGSSVATAIASGLAALTIACCRISTRCTTDNSEGTWRCRMVRNTFKKIASGNAGGVPWVDTERFCCKNDELAQQKFDFQHTVNENFRF